MKAFAQLVDALSATTKTNEKIAALENYFSIADDKDKVWVIALFSGRRPKRTISSTMLKDWCSEFCSIPLWLLNIIIQWMFLRNLYSCVTCFHQQSDGF